ncbi:hypothetical protein [Vreelandella titanicae]|uniref:hypothetical protein n=1 Tax=Vreelandella titanicae TaxID=664683 RepID=UPI0038298537
MKTKTISAIALMFLGLSMVLAANLGAADKESLHRAYCAEVAVWQAEEARGVKPTRRTGHPDYRGIAAGSCPGLRPAP